MTAVSFAVWQSGKRLLNVWVARVFNNLPCAIHHWYLLQWSIALQTLKAQAVFWDSSIQYSINISYSCATSLPNNWAGSLTSGCLGIPRRTPLGPIDFIKIVMWLLIPHRTTSRICQTARRTTSRLNLKSVVAYMVWKKLAIPREVKVWERKRRADDFVSAALNALKGDRWAVPSWHL